MKPDVSSLDSLSWLRNEDVEFVREKIRAGDELVPLPKSPRLDPITWLDLAGLLASHNAWVRLWNVHETDRALPLSPDWWDGETIASGHYPHRLLVSERKSGQVVQVKMDNKWWTFFPGWSCCRNEAPLARVKWAGTERKQRTRR